MAVNKLGRYAKLQALEAVMRRTQSPAAGAVYVALATSATVASDVALTMADASITEYAATGYARQQVEWNAAAIVGTAGRIANTNVETWGPFTAGTGAIVRYAIVCDHVSLTSANVIAVIQLTTDRTPATGDSLQAAATTAITVDVD